MKRKSITKLILGALVFGSMMSVLGSVDAFAVQQFKNQFVLSNGEWSYYKENGQIARDETIVIDGKEYKFDKDGKYILSAEEQKRQNERKLYKEKYQKTNECSEEYKKRDDRWCNKDGNWYFNYEGTYTDEGRYENEWHFINGYWYHFNEYGIMDKNITIKDEKGNDCILNSDGVLTNREEPEFEDDYDDPKENCSLKVIDGSSYFINGYGKKITGWVMYQGKWYYMNNEGVMQKNKTIIEGSKKYVLGADGAWIK